METLKDFKVEEVIGNRPPAKQLAILGRFAGSDSPAVMLVTQSHLPEDKAADLLSADTNLRLQFQNDVYSKYDAQLPSNLVPATIDMIYPATELHIKKHRDQEYAMIREDPDRYLKCTKAYVESIPASRLQWVYNALEKKAEADRIVFEDEDPSTGFMLHPDLKWDQKKVEELYCLAMCHRRGIGCLRDLDASHLPLLKNIRRKGCEAIAVKYGVGKDQMRIYVHYPPSYYHFHVHFVHINVLGGGVAMGRAHLLDDIIDNIETIDPNYYKLRTLSFVLGKGTPHWEFFQSGNG